MDRRLTGVGDYDRTPPPKQPKKPKAPRVKVIIANKYGKVKSEK